MQILIRIAVRIVGLFSWRLDDRRWFVDGGGRYIGGRSGPAAVFNLHHVLVTSQVTDVLFRGFARADRQGTERRVRHVCGRHGELDVAEMGQRFGYLVMRQQIDATQERVGGVRTCNVRAH